MSEEKQCKICHCEIESDNKTHICYSCQSIIANIEHKVDGFN